MTEQEAAQMKRLQQAVEKLADWSGNDISDLIVGGLLKEGDLDG